MTEANNKIVCSRVSVDENATELVSENFPNMAMTEQRAAELAEKVAAKLFTSTQYPTGPEQPKYLSQRTQIYTLGDCLGGFERSDVVAKVKRILMDG